MAMVMNPADDKFLIKTNGRFKVENMDFSP